MKQIFTHLRQVAAATAVAVAALCPASLFAQGTVVASNTMSATTPDGVTIDLPIVSQGNWTIAPNGASAEIGTTGADNYGPCLAAPLPGSWIGVMVDVEEAGRYVFSFRAKVDSGIYNTLCTFGYGDGAGGEWTSASSSWFTPIPKDADEVGDVFESQTIDLKAGPCFFVLQVDNMYGSATNLHVADFQLTYVEPAPASYTVSYTVEGGEADVHLYNYSAAGSDPVEIKSGEQWNAWTMYRLDVTPANPAEQVSISVNGANVNENVESDGDIPYVYYGYVINTDVDIVISVGSGIEGVGSDDAGVTYDTAAALLSGQCGRTEIYDLSGKLVRVLDLRGTADLSSLDHGVYVVRTAAGTIKIAR